jgi:hypothetical protein
MELADQVVELHDGRIAEPARDAVERGQGVAMS